MYQIKRSAEGHTKPDCQIHEETPANKKLWERRDAALREMEQSYKTDEPVFGAMYMTPSGTLIDCSAFPNGHADVSAWLNEKGLEIDYRLGEPSKLLYLKGWLRLNTKVGYIEEPHGVLTAQQRERLESILTKGNFYGQLLQSHDVNEKEVKAKQGSV